MGEKVPRTGEYPVDCEKMRHLITVRCKLDPNIIPKKTTVSRFAWDKMYGRDGISKFHNAKIDLVKEVLIFVRQHLKLNETTLPLSTIRWDNNYASSNSLSHNPPEPELSKRFFENSWPTISKRLSIAIMDGLSWINDIEYNMERNKQVSAGGMYNPGIPNEIMKILIHNNPLHALAIKYNCLCDSLGDAAVKYRLWVFPATRSFHFVNLTIGLGKAIDPDSDDSEEKQQVAEVVDSLKMLCARYNIPSNAMLVDLISCPAYKSDIEQLRQELTLGAKGLRALADEISEKVAFYDVTFAR